MNVLVATASGCFSIDAESEEVEPWGGDVADPPAPVLNLPRVVAAAALGGTVVAVVDARPPLLISHDSGSTWHQSGRGLPAGRAVAIAEETPDVIAYGARNRVYLSRNGGVFWTALAVELPEIERIELRS